MSVDVLDDHRTVFIEHQVEDGVLARQLANRLAPAGLYPDAALVGKGDRGRIGLEVLGGQPGNGIVAGLGGSVENLDGDERSQPGSLLLPIDSANLQFCLWHLDSGPSGTRQPVFTPATASPRWAYRLHKERKTPLVAAPHSICAATASRRSPARACCSSPASPLSEGTTPGIRLRQGCPSEYQPQGPGTRLGRSAAPFQSTGRRVGRHRPGSAGPR